MILRNLSVIAATAVITWSAVFNTCHCQSETTVDGPANTAYVSPGGSESFNCSVSWSATSGDLDSILWKRSTDDGTSWVQIAQCFKAGDCNIVGEYAAMYWYEVVSTELFKLIITSATLDEDGLYDCHHFDDANPAAPHAKLVVLDQVDDVSIDGFPAVGSDTVIAGDEKSYTCRSTAGNPAASLIWTIGDVDITSHSVNSTSENTNDDRLYDTESTLTYSFNASDDGNDLRCRGFQHDSLAIRSSRIEMTVEYAPVIHYIDILDWGDNYMVEVECVASANPDSISYSWTNNENSATGSGKTWTVEDVNQDNFIDVTCEATNSIGSTELRKELSKPFDPTTRSLTPTPVVGDPAPSTGSSGCDTGCIIGVSVAAGIIVLVIIVLLLWIFLSRQKKQGEKYGSGGSNHKQPPHTAPADVEMATTGHVTKIPSVSDDADNRYNDYANYSDRYDDRYDNTSAHRYDQPPDEYSQSPRYDEPPIDEGDGYPNYSNPSSPNYSSYDRRQQAPPGTPGLHYTDLDLGPSSQDYQPQGPTTEYATITPTIV